MKKKIALSVLFCLIAFPVFAATYYVDATDGDDSNLGFSPCCPWKTIAKINSFSFNPNDEILFKCGEVWNEQLIVPSSNLEIGTYGVGDKPIIDATGFTNAILVNGKSNIIIWGLHLKNAVADNLFIRYIGNTGHVFDMLIENAGQHGIMFLNGPNGWLVENNIIRLNTSIGIHLDGGMVNPNNDGAFNNMITKNTIYSNGLAGIGLEDGADNNFIVKNECYLNGRGIYVSSSNQSPSSNVFEYNKLYSNEHGILLIQKGDNTTIQYNHVYQNTGYGISLDGAGVGNQIKYNILLNNASESWAHNAAIYISQCTVEIKDNIIGNQVIFVQ